MLTVEIKVNGSTIDFIYVVRKPSYSMKSKGGRDIFNYNYEYFRPEKGVFKGSVDHFYDDGSIKLVKKILMDVDKNGPWD